jgi:hypothetical protein
MQEKIENLDIPYKIAVIELLQTAGGRRLKL